MRRTQRLSAVTGHRAPLNVRSFDTALPVLSTPRLRPVVFTTWVDLYAGNRVFDREQIATFRKSLHSMALPWLRVSELGREHGFELMTADQVQARDLDPRDVLLISYDWTPEAAALLAAGARPVLTTTMEPPVIAWSYYFNLRRITARFPHAYLFSGARARTAPSTRFHPLLFPQVQGEAFHSGEPWAARRYLTMVNSNKAIVRSWTRWLDEPREVSVKRALASLLYPTLSRDMYPLRIKVIEHFSRHPDFDLYGEGWDHKHPQISQRDYQMALGTFRGRSEDKLETLSHYRFALCLENSRFPGYLSEKIFDCFYTGCIPIYLGDPEVTRHVSPDAFVDMAQFSSLPELDAFLGSITPDQAERYLEAGRQVVTAPAFQAFSQEAFARKVVSILVQEAERSGTSR